MTEWLRATRISLLAALAIFVGGCSAPAASEVESESPAASVEVVPSATAAPSASAAPASEPPASEAPEAEAATLRTLIAAAPESPMLTREEELAGGDGFASSVVSYESDGFTIYGVLHTPDGEGPFPGVVLVHGAVDPDSWSAQTDYVEFQQRLVSVGFVVLVPDLRNHGASDDDPAYELALEMGTTLDVVNAARALAVEPAVDPGRIVVIGHSLGGAMTLGAMVVAPDVAGAFVAMAPSHASPWENIRQFVPPGSPFYMQLTDLHGTPDDNPEFWADVSALTFVDRAARPLLVVHGTADDVVPPEWANIVGTAWADAGKDVQVVMIEGADHVFSPAEDETWAAVFTFLQAQLP